MFISEKMTDFSSVSLRSGGSDLPLYQMRTLSHPRSSLAHMAFQNTFDSILGNASETHLKRIDRLAKIENLYNPERIKNLICSCQFTDRTKNS